MKVLVAVITGGRPALKDRVTHRFFPDLRATGFPDIEWVIREDHVASYEQDDTPMNVYPVEWASDYAHDHWRHPTARWEHGGFFGAFPGREWAMQTAEERGYDAVLQLDDNVIRLGVLNANQPSYRSVMSPGRMLRLLVELSASTNAMMLGAQLNSTPPTRFQVIRPGYPYSVFIERTGSGRMPYYGPFEDDIMHALEYARNGGANRTAGVVEAFRYYKHHQVSGGMRGSYDGTRGLEISRRYPDNARIGEGKRTSSPNDRQRGVRHFLNTRGFTPIRVTDRERYDLAAKETREAVTRAVAAKREWDRAKMRRRGGLSA